MKTKSFEKNAAMNVNATDGALAPKAQVTVETLLPMVKLCCWNAALNRSMAVKISRTCAMWLSEGRVSLGEAITPSAKAELDRISIGSTFVLPPKPAGASAVAGSGNWNCADFAALAAKINVIRTRKSECAANAALVILNA